MSETVKPFTEDQRNRLAFAIENHAPNWVDKDNLAGLLARLAAAEYYAEAGRALLYDDHKLSAEEMFRRFEIARKKWLATRGIGI